MEDLHNPHFFQKCCHFLWNQVSEKYNPFERNEDCATVFLKWTDFKKMTWNKKRWFSFQFKLFIFSGFRTTLQECSIGWLRTPGTDPTSGPTQGPTWSSGGLTDPREGATPSKRANPRGCDPLSSSSPSQASSPSAGIKTPPSTTNQSGWLRFGQWHYYSR